MKWSWTIGRIAGIRVRMHWTFLILLVWVAASYAARGEGWEAAGRGVGFVLAIFACIVLHETGHALAARRYGVETEDITLLPIGGLARMQRIPSEPWQEFWIAVAGPAVNVVIAAVLFLVLWAQAGAAAVPSEPSFAASFLGNLIWVNMILVAFNILPAFPMDGGRIFRALLATRMPYARATQTAATVGQAMAILFGIAGFFVNPFLLFIALFVYLGAEAENQMVQLHDVLGDAPVQSAMMTRFRTLAPKDTLQTAVDELLAGAQQDFPVADESDFRGMLRRRDLVEALQKSGPQAEVDSAITPIETRLTEHDNLRESLERMRQMNCQSLPVFRDGQLVGLLTLENVGEFVMVRSATQGQDPKPPTKDVGQAA
jgi:Zn-dependent protease